MNETPGAKNPSDQDDRTSQRIDGRDFCRAGELRARAAILLGPILALTLLIRLYRLDQPIVENYVGRQIPTAMVARNLERGSGFLNPQLDTGPFPNYFPVEPPLYEQLAVWLKRASGLTLEESGRLLSAIGTVLAAWGLFGLARRREGIPVALLAVLVFSAFPVTIRYGRSFQPDALMLGLLILGLSRLDAIRDRDARRRPVACLVAWLLIASGLALKVTSAYILVPMVICICRSGWRTRLAFAASTLLPALAWYLWANHLVNSGEGSRASADNRAIWLSVLMPSALLSARLWILIGRYVLWKCFTPLGPILMAGGFRGEPNPGIRDRLWPIWGTSAAAALLALAAKLHHEYYWLALAPVVAIGVGRGLVAIERRFRGAGWILAAAFLATCGVLSRSTWDTPNEWRHLEEAGRIVRENVPPDALVVAPEALLYQGGRRGCRLEFSPPGCERAAGEWGERLAEPTAICLVEMYRGRDARYFADLGAGEGRGREETPQRVALHEAIRRRYKVIVDLPAILLAEIK